MRERIEQLGARLQIDSQPGPSMAIRATMPLAEKIQTRKARILFVVRMSMRNKALTCPLQAGERELAPQHTTRILNTTPLKELGSYRKARKEREDLPYELGVLSGLCGEIRAFCSRV